jgi:PRTRC genetic system protein C
MRSARQRLFFEVGSNTCQSLKFQSLQQEEETRMSQLKAEAMVREFHYNGIRIPDPGPDLTVDQVRDLITPQFPEVATASVSGPEAAGSVLRYTFSRAIGTKG